MIFTFYSFKGGVGRTMAMANVAELLYRRRFSVLMVDFDLEAPGLERFFPDSASPPITGQRGVLDMLCSYQDLYDLERSAGKLPADLDTPEAIREFCEPLCNFVTTVYPPNESGGALYLIPAGRRDGKEFARYAERLRGFDWDDFYLNWSGEAFFDWFREEAERYKEAEGNKKVDVVLIDSRTGITEMSGVCTFHLADIVVMFVATNQQNLDGTRFIADSLTDDLVSEARKRRKLARILVPSRVESSESDPLKEFKRRFEETLTGIMSPDLVPTFATDGFTDLKIPYVPRYAIMEQVAVREPDQPVAADLVAAYTRLAAAMVALDPRLSRRFSAPPTLLFQPDSADPLAQPIPDYVERPWVLRRTDDWLARPEPRVLLITGVPGSGKTAIANRLVRLSEGAEADEEYPRLGPGALAFAHACQGGETLSLDPGRFIERLALSLAQRYPVFATALTQMTLTGVEVRQAIDASSSANPATGPTIAQIEIGDVPPHLALEHLVRRPLTALCGTDFNEAVVLLVDGVDEALAFPGKVSIFDLLSKMVSPIEGLPPQVRLVLTSRPEPRVLAALTGERFDLIDDAPAESDAVREFAKLRLRDVEASQRAVLAARVAEASAGNFLFARYAIEEVQRPGEAGTESKRSTLPEGLAGAYEELLTREVGEPTSKRWINRDRPLLGALAVAADGGLTAAQLASVLKLRDSELEEARRGWERFLAGPRPDGPFHPFHLSFRNYLLAPGPFQVFAGESHQAIADYALHEYGRQWLECRDDYALRFTLTHLMAAIANTPTRRARSALVEKLTDLLFNSNYTEVKTAKLGKESTQADRAALEASATSPEYGEDLAAIRQRLFRTETPPDTPVQVPALVSSRIDAQTGESSALTVDDLPQAAQYLKIDPQHEAELRWRERQATMRHLGPVAELDAGDLAQAGWGIVFARNVDPDDVREALAELLSHRRTQASGVSERRYREFVGADSLHRNESWYSFLARHGSGPGPIDPDVIPYYLLIVGDPETIPFEIQSQMAVQRAVGRLHFDTLKEYARYARRVVASERGEVALPRRAAVFGTRHPNDPNTEYSEAFLVRPLVERLAADRPEWTFDRCLGEEATKARLGALLCGTEPLALLAATTRSVGFPNQDPRQRDEQGALVCQDWPGPGAGPHKVPGDFYFAAHDLSGDARFPAFVALFSTGYGAGTPRREEVLGRTQRIQVAKRAFVARLAQRLLGHSDEGALALLGQVGDAWPERPADRPDLLASVLNSVMDGRPVGSAMDLITARYASLAGVLTAEQEEIRYFGKRADVARLRELWAATSNLRGLTIIGDPAVRLPVPASA